MKKNIIATGLLAAAMLIANIGEACTNFLFTKGATKDGSTMITYAADSHTLYGELYYRRAANYPEGTMFMLFDWDSGKQLFEIPQVAHTYNVVGNMNEHQLAIGETTFGGREECWGAKGIDYGSLIYVTLQRAKTAREAIKVMAQLVESYGYCSEGESFSICDPKEVWVMDFIGKGHIDYDTVKGKAVARKGFKGLQEKGAIWVARRVPDGYVCGHANQARITTFPQVDKKSKTHQVITSKDWKYLDAPEVECIYAWDVILWARAKGWYTGSDADFSFTDTYAPLSFSGVRGCDARVYAMFHRINPKLMEQYEDYAMGWNNDNRMPLWIKPDHKVDVQEVMNLMRDHYEGTKMDMTQDVGAGPFQCPYRWRPMGFEVDGKKYVHERATSTQQTGFSFVAQCRDWLPNILGGILWFGVDDTYSTCYCPMYCGITEIPECFRQGNGDMLTYSETAAFWLFNRVTNFCYSRYNDMIADLQVVQSRLESEFIQEVDHNDHLCSKMAEPLIQERINAFSTGMANRMMDEWNKLDKYLLVKYIDGNVKKEKDGKFERTATGQAAFPNQPKYPDWFYRKIVEDHGDVVIEK